MLVNIQIIQIVSAKVNYLIHLLKNVLKIIDETKLVNITITENNNETKLVNITITENNNETKLVNITITENNNQTKLVNITIAENENSHCNSCKVYIVLMIVTIVISTGVTIYFVYYNWSFIKNKVFALNLILTKK